MFTGVAGQADPSCNKQRSPTHVAGGGGSLILVGCRALSSTLTTPTLIDRRLTPPPSPALSAGVVRFTRLNQIIALQPDDYHIEVTALRLPGVFTIHVGSNHERDVFMHSKSASSFSGHGLDHNATTGRSASLQFARGSPLLPTKSRLHSPLSTTAAKHEPSLRANLHLGFSVFQRSLSLRRFSSKWHTRGWWRGNVHVRVENAVENKWRDGEGGVVEGRVYIPIFPSATLSTAVREDRGLAINLAQARKWHVLRSDVVHEAELLSSDVWTGAAAVQRLESSLPGKGESGSIHRRGRPTDFRTWESCRTIVAGRRVFSGFSKSLHLLKHFAFQRCSILTSFHPHRLSRLPVLTGRLPTKPAFHATWLTHPATQPPLLQRGLARADQTIPYTQRPVYLGWASQLEAMSDCWETACCRTHRGPGGSSEVSHLSELAYTAASRRRGGKREIPEKTHRPTASTGTIPACEDPEVPGRGLNPVRLAGRRAV
ncbi:hypothetical protein PR048_031354 [Dryococelus australis]|uniref:Uncharacterized protein n=1 Tax=Dryococelus australis TaxID=614101 RepID=A0ABQ9G7W8_9NEOP|nr:hypothetical protein PR048_031354 [Dryococelus australis]